MNLPNTLTVNRIFLTFIFIILLLQNGLTAKIFAAIVFAVASLTDLLDGYYAKKKNLVTDFGKLLDPIADKFLILSTFFVFVKINFIAPWMFWVMAAREIGITLFRVWAVQKGEALAAERAGKYKTVAQIVAIGVALLFLILRESTFAVRWPTGVYYSWYALINLMMFIAVAFTLISGILYLWNNRRLMNASSLS